MFAWLAANLINIVLILAVVLLVAVLIRSLVQDKKAGKSPCGGSCSSCGSGCAGCGACAGKSAGR